MVEWLDCENCRHLTVVGLHDTGPRFSTGRPSSPFQGSTAHPNMRGGAIKGVLKKAHPETKTG